ncbi:MAG: hypothetical protein ACJ74U_04890 [Jatrophihabitantaceae bacterium]
MRADTSRSLAAALERFDAELNAPERQLLRGLLVSSMTPLERVRFLNAGPLLSTEEWAALRGGPVGDDDRG